MLTATSRLEAVNIMLAAIGADPVDTIDEANDVDVANATRLLDKVSKSVQIRGWDFNTYTLTVQPDLANNNQITWDDTWLKWSCDTTTIVKRNGKIFDFTNQTYQFTSALTVTAMVALDFEDLPECFREFIAIKAAYDFQAVFMGDQSISQDLQVSLQMAERGLVEYDMSMDTYNMLQLTGIAGNLGRT